MYHFISLLAILSLGASNASTDLVRTQSPERFPIVNRIAFHQTFTVFPGNEDYTQELSNLFATAPAGSTIRFMPGTYPAKLGTTYLIGKDLNIVGYGNATLVNVRIQTLANISIDGVNFFEKDCTYKSTSPTSCPVLPPLISIGAAGYPISLATINNVRLTYTRAYTGIAFGFDVAKNISITNFTITDGELSGITALAGDNISIANGSIVGGTDSNVDDGIALYSAAGELSNVTVSNVSANNAFDVVGIGALLYFPMHDITVKQSKCQQTAVCIYLKAGDSAPAPAQYAGYSQMARVTIDGVNDSDPAGARYLSTVWIYAKGGASASDISINNVSATTRSASASTPRIWLFTDAQSRIANVQLQNMELTDRFNGNPENATTAGLPEAEGVFFEDQGNADISNINLSKISLNGTAYYAIDSSLAQVEGLSVMDSSFTNIGKAQPQMPLFLIPYEYVLDGEETP